MVLAAVSTHPQVAYYSLAVVIAEAAWLMPSALAVTPPPRTSCASRATTRARGAAGALRRTVAVAGASGVVAAAGGVGGMLALLPHAYHAALAPLAIVLAGAVPYSVGHVVSPYLVTAVDRPGIATVIAVATLTVDIGAGADPTCPTPSKYSAPSLSGSPLAPYRPVSWACHGRRRPCGRAALQARLPVDNRPQFVFPPPRGAKAEPLTT